MGIEKIFGHSSKGTEYCRGFVDEHGQWNNGFYCPKWGGPDRQYCCGPDEHKYCCPKEDVKEILHDKDTHHVSLMVGLAVGSFVLLVATVFLSCYFCRCCWGYKRRKRIQGVSASIASHGVIRRRPRRHADYPVSYHVCPHGTLLPDFMIPVAQYPADDPPPYPGEPGIPLEEKQPLQELEVYPGMDTPHRFHMSWRHGQANDSVSESDKSSSNMDGSPLPLKVSDTYPLLNMGINGGYNKAGECMGLGGGTDRAPYGEKHLSTSSGSVAFVDSLPSTSRGYETWPRSATTTRDNRDWCQLDASVYASTESNDSGRG